MVVTRESEWDEVARARAEALTFVEDTTCSGCGNDLNHTLEVEEPYDVDDKTVCHACRALAIIRRLDEHNHESEDKQAGPAQPRHGDGRIYTVSPMDWKDV